jgi:hypothetical protein
MLRIRERIEELSDDVNVVQSGGLADGERRGRRRWRRARK